MISYLNHVKDCLVDYSKTHTLTLNSSEMKYYESLVSEVLNRSFLHIIHSNCSTKVNDLEQLISMPFTSLYKKYRYTLETHIMHVCRTECELHQMYICNEVMNRFYLFNLFPLYHATKYPPTDVSGIISISNGKHWEKARLQDIPSIIYHETDERFVDFSVIFLANRLYREFENTMNCIKKDYHL